MTTTIYEHNGKKYRLADERDIGKLVWRSETDFYTAMQNNLSRTSLEAYNPDAYSKYKTAFGYWQFAFVELEPEAAEPPRPDWLPEAGSRILGEDDVIQNGDRYWDGYCSNLAQYSIGKTHKQAKEDYDPNWVWWRPAPPESTTTETEQVPEVPDPAATVDYKSMEERVKISLSASRYLAACREHTRAIEELSGASQEMQELLKNRPRKFIIKDFHDCKYHLFEVNVNGTFTSEVIDML